jgi:hypothetical protein
VLNTHSKHLLNQRLEKYTMMIDMRLWMPTCVHCGARCGPPRSGACSGRRFCGGGGGGGSRPGGPPGGRSSWNGPWSCACWTGQPRNWPTHDPCLKEGIRVSMKERELGGQKVGEMKKLGLGRVCYTWLMPCKESRKSERESKLVGC